MKPRSSDPPPRAQQRILLVDDHALLRRGLAMLIGTEPDLVVWAEAGTCRAALEVLAAGLPELAIVDLSLKDGDGLELVKDLKRRYPKLPVLVLSMHEETLYAERALRAGAGGYVTKQEMDDTVLVAIRRVLAGGVHISEAMGREFTRKFMAGGTLEKTVGLERLSDREFEVFQLIGCGKSTREIAKFLGLSVKTIESHREHIKLKLELSSGTDLARCATVWIETGHYR